MGVVKQRSFSRHSMATIVAKIIGKATGVFNRRFASHHRTMEAGAAHCAEGALKKIGDHRE
jgi:hypothetical protein